jgi:tetratricopeptide (TPR) repeat protein
MDVNPYAPTPNPLQDALERYKISLDCLVLPKTPIDNEQALEMLLARDVLQKQMELDLQVPVEILSKIKELDARLKQQAYRITEILNLGEYRVNLPIPPEAWWWHLEKVGELYPLDRHDWVLRGLRITAWAVNLGLLGALATRFLSGGSGLFEAIAITFPSVLALLQAKNELTEAGQKGSDKLLTKLGISPHWQEEAKLGSTLVVTALLVGVWLLQPSIAEWYNREGLKQQWKHKQLKNAEQNYLKAIAFNSENLDAHYNLGYLYEEWLDVDNAQKQYAIAAKGGLPDAYNNLTRLYILQKKYPEATTLLYPIVSKIQLDPKQAVTEEVKYSLFKNYGWARFAQDPDDEEASIYLHKAVEIADRPEIVDYILNPGAAHCLLAQLMERQKQPQFMAHWEKCRDLISSRRDKEQIHPEEDKWLDDAKKKLNKRGK